MATGVLLVSPVAFPLWTVWLSSRSRFNSRDCDVAIVCLLTRLGFFQCRLIRISQLKKFIGGEHLVGIEDQAELLPRTRHAEQVVDFQTCTEGRCRLQLFRFEIDDLAYC